MGEPILPSDPSQASTALPKVNIGDLVIPVAVEQRNTGIETDSGGGVSYTTGWNTLFPRVFVGDKVRVFNSIAADGTLMNAVRHTITMRYRLGILEGMRLTKLAGLDVGRHWYIQAVDDVGGFHRWLSLTCIETEPVG
jgi:hypothetical protein